MPKHYSQKEAIGLADENLALKKSIDKFFDVYNGIRGNIEGLLESEVEVLENIIATLVKPDPALDLEATANEVKERYPEFFTTWSEIERQRGQLEAIKTVERQLKLILRPEWSQEELN